jgi:hypothetical protein
MSEKRGFTGKLIFDFNPTAVLEIQYNGEDVWYRVTAETFRSFDGKRRYTQPAYAQKGIATVPMDVIEYDGPVYIWGTNTKAIKENLGKTISSPKLESMLKASSQALSKGW